MEEVLQRCKDNKVGHDERRQQHFAGQAEIENIKRKAHDCGDGRDERHCAVQHHRNIRGKRMGKVVRKEREKEYGRCLDKTYDAQKVAQRDQPLR